MNAILRPADEVPLYKQDHVCLNIRVPRDLHRRVKRHAIDTDDTMQTVIQKALRQYLGDER